MSDSENAAEISGGGSFMEHEGQEPAPKRARMMQPAAGPSPSEQHCRGHTDIGVSHAAADSTKNCIQKGSCMNTDHGVVSGGPQQASRPVARWHSSHTCGDGTRNAGNDNGCSGTTAPPHQSVDGVGSIVRQLPSRGNRVISCSLLQVRAMLRHAGHDDGTTEGRLRVCIADAPAGAPCVSTATIRAVITQKHAAKRAHAVLTSLGPLVKVLQAQPGDWLRLEPQPDGTFRASCVHSRSKCSVHPGAQPAPVPFAEYLRGVRAAAAAATVAAPGAFPPAPVGVAVPQGGEEAVQHGTVVVAAQQRAATHTQAAAPAHAITAAAATQPAAAAHSMQRPSPAQHGQPQIPIAGPPGHFHCLSTCPPGGSLAINQLVEVQAESLSGGSAVSSSSGRDDDAGRHGLSAPRQEGSEVQHSSRQAWPSCQPLMLRVGHDLNRMHVIDAGRAIASHAGLAAGEGDITVTAAATQHRLSLKVYVHKGRRSARLHGASLLHALGAGCGDLVRLAPLAGGVFAATLERDPVREELRRMGPAGLLRQLPMTTLTPAQRTCPPLQVRAMLQHARHPEGAERGTLRCCTSAPGATAATVNITASLFTDNMGRRIGRLGSLGLLQRALGAQPGDWLRLEPQPDGTFRASCAAVLGGPARAVEHPQPGSGVATVGLGPEEREVGAVGGDQSPAVHMSRDRGGAARRRRGSDSSCTASRGSCSVGADGSSARADAPDGRPDEVSSGRHASGLHQPPSASPRREGGGAGEGADGAWQAKQQQWPAPLPPGQPRPGLASPGGPAQNRLPASLTRAGSADKACPAIKRRLTANTMKLLVASPEQVQAMLQHAGHPLEAAEGMLSCDVSGALRGPSTVSIKAALQCRTDPRVTLGMRLTGVIQGLRPLMEALGARPGDVMRLKPQPGGTFRASCSDGGGKRGAAQAQRHELQQALAAGEGPAAATAVPDGDAKPHGQAQGPALELVEGIDGCGGDAQAPQQGLPLAQLLRSQQRQPTGWPAGGAAAATAAASVVVSPPEGKEQRPATQATLSSQPHGSNGGHDGGSGGGGGEAGGHADGNAYTPGAFDALPLRPGTCTAGVALSSATSEATARAMACPKHTQPAHVLGIGPGSAPPAAAAAQPAGGGRRRPASPQPAASCASSPVQRPPAAPRSAAPTAAARSPEAVAAAAVCGSGSRRAAAAGATASPAPARLQGNSVLTAPHPLRPLGLRLAGLACGPEGSGGLAVGSGGGGGGSTTSCVRLQGLRGGSFALPGRLGMGVRPPGVAGAVLPVQAANAEAGGGAPLGVPAAAGR